MRVLHAISIFFLLPHSISHFLIPLYAVCRVTEDILIMGSKMHRDPQHTQTLQFSFAACVPEENSMQVMIETEQALRPWADNWTHTESQSLTGFLSCVTGHPMPCRGFFSGLVQDVLRDGGIFTGKIIDTSKPRWLLTKALSHVSLWGTVNSVALFSRLYRLRPVHQ